MFMLAVALVVGYFVIQTTGFIVHKALHHPALGRVHKTHDIHHKTMYPPEDYLDVGKYREVPDESQPYKYYAPAALLLICAAFLTLPIYIAVSLSVELVVIAWANDWLHQKLHIKGHWLERFTWFHHLRELHWYHHVDDTKNLGIFSWFPDKMLSTYTESPVRPPYLEPLPKDTHLAPISGVFTAVDVPDQVCALEETVQLDSTQH